MKVFIFACAFLILIAAHPAAAAPPHHVRIVLVPRSTVLQPGETLPVAIEETIDPGWHTYWINPGDAGQAPDVAWTLPPGLKAGALKFPAPERALEGPLATFGYHDRVTLLQDIVAPATLPARPLALKAHIGILVCKDICIPEEGDYSLTLNNGAAENHGDEVAAAQADIVDETAGAPARMAEEGGMLVLTVSPAPSDYGGAAELLPADWGLVDNAQPAQAAIQKGDLVVRQKRAERALKDVTHFHVLVAYQDKSGARQVRAYDATTGTATPSAHMNAGGLWQAVMLAVLGGLILNLMPCVFPVLSLKALKLCTLSGKELAAARNASLLYTLGILVSFGTLALLLIGLRAGGQQIGWGFQLQNPIFVLPLAWLLLLIGLNLSGYYEVGGRFVGVGSKWAAGHGAAASFFTGVLAAVVATPCTAPFMGVAIGYALTQGAATALVIFLSLGFGLALPFLVISFVPALQRAMPKPGAWMVTFRELLAFPMFMSAAWLVWVFSLQAGANAVMVALAGGVFIVFALWLLARKARLPRWLALPVVIAALALIPLAGRMEAHNMTVREAGSDWQPFTAEKFSALEKGNDPIFVDMTAAWCITCKVNENAVLDTPAIAMLFHKAHVQTMRGDWTNRNPEVSDFLQQRGRDGVPLYVYYGLRGPDGQRPEPVVLPQLLTPGIVQKIIEGVPGS